MKCLLILFFLNIISIQVFADNSFETFLSSLKSKVAANKKNEVSALFTFPLKMEVNLIETTYQSKQDFIKSFETIFTPSVKAALHKQKLSSVRKKGGLWIVGNGQLWIKKTKHGTYTINRLFK